MTTQRADVQSQPGCQVSGGSHREAAMLSLSTEAAAEQAGLDQRPQHFLPARPGLGGAASPSLSLICEQTYQNARRD